VGELVSQDPAERREKPFCKTLSRKHGRDLNLMDVSTVQAKIAELAAKHEKLIALNHFLTPELVGVALSETRRDGALGVDGRTAEDFAKELDKKIELAFLNFPDEKLSRFPIEYTGENRHGSKKKDLYQGIQGTSH
jgi:hypothetical protein